MTDVGGDSGPTAARPPDRSAEVAAPAHPDAPLDSFAAVAFLRTTQLNLVQLSQMADQKANIVLGASFIMITIIVGISSSSGLTASLATLGGFTMISAILALLAVMPTLPGPSRVSSNPLYFGDIAGLEKREHRDLLHTYVSDRAKLFELVAADIHESAAVLRSKKFAFLRAAYMVFIAGLVATAVVMAIEWATGNI